MTVYEAQTLKGQVVASGFSTASEYTRALIREDQKRRAEEKLEALLIEGLNSGEPVETTPEYWERKRVQLVDRHGQRPGPR